MDAIYLSYMHFAQSLLGSTVKIKIMIVGIYSEMWYSIGKHMKWEVKWLMFLLILTTSLH